MIHCVLAVYDEKAEAFAAPFFQQSDVLALRVFSAGARDPESLLYKFPRDYGLYKLGTYDDNTGRFENLERPSLLMTAQQAQAKLTPTDVALDDPAVAERFS